MSDDDEYTSVRDRPDRSDRLASFPATAAVALDTDRRVTHSCVQRAGVLLGIELPSAGVAIAERSCLPGRLASWRARRVSAYIEDKLAAGIRVTDLAGLVRLSTSHFSRAFRNTFGESPLVYVMKRRVLRAQKLMLNSQLPLTQIALECGMSDQAHFSRTFRRIVGTNPARWRRQFLLGPASGKLRT